MLKHIISNSHTSLPDTKTSIFSFKYSYIFEIPHLKNGDVFWGRFDQSFFLVWGRFD